MVQSIDSLKNRYLKLRLEDPCESDETGKIETALNVKLPTDFKFICSFYSGGYLGCHSIFTFSSDNDDYNITQKTLFYRESINLPHSFIGLSEGDVSLILLDTSTGQVLYISTEDAYNLCEGRSLEYNPIIFPNFADFFDYLLTQEEIELGIKESKEIMASEWVAGER